MSVITDYLTYQQKYEAIYGAKTVILYQKGDFYQILEYDPMLCLKEEDKIDDQGKIWHERIGWAVYIKENIFHCELTSINKKKPYSIRNPNMIGFPAVTYNKKLKILLSNDFNVIRVDQKPDEFLENGNTLRYVSEICSPTMNFNNISLNELHVNIISIYIEFIKSKNNINNFDGYLITSGISMINIITGESTITEFYSKDNNEIYCTQEIYRFLYANNPKEIIINIDDMPSELSDDVDNNPYVKYLENILELQRYDHCHVKINKVSSEYKKNNYHIEFFNKLYNKKFENVIKYTDNKILNNLDLEQLYYGRMAFLLLIKYCRKSNGPIEFLHKPNIIWFDVNKFLILNHNAALCLNIASSKLHKQKINSLFSVMNKTCTKIGARCLEHLLLNPMLDSEEIESFYSMIEEFSLKTINNEDLWQIINNYLTDIPDIERLQRKIELKIISPIELACLLTAYHKIIKVFNFIKTQNIYYTKQIINRIFNIEPLNLFIETYTNIFNLEHLHNCYIENKVIVCEKNIFNNNNEINLLYDILHDKEKKINAIQEHMNNFLSNRGKVKAIIKELGKNGKPKKGQIKSINVVSFFTISTANASKLINSNYDKTLCGELKISNYNTEKIISSDIIDELWNSKDLTIKNIGLLSYDIYIKHLNDMLTFNFFTSLNNVVGIIDIIQSHTKISKLYKYYRPDIIHDGASHLKIKNLRHPIIEQIIDDKYIVNDVNLGKSNENDDSEYGLLLYGVNMCGKSSFIKAIGLNIIMAQCGSYVPCNLIYKPYANIITRLSSHDNLFKGESSYEIELTELRTALRQKNSNTLVLLDEIAKSTESQSAKCITVATIVYLINNKMSFACSSHLHEIVDLPFIINLKKNMLNISHLSVTYDEINDLLIYDRKLKEGSGISKYGLDVAKYLKLPTDFLTLANEISLYLNKENLDFLSTKKSKHNSKVYMDTCALCGENINLITHHIEEQKLSDVNGFIDNMHKNVKTNLLPLCENCHINKIHKHNIQLKSLQTVNGNLITY